MGDEVLSEKETALQWEEGAGEHHYEHTEYKERVETGAKADPQAQCPTHRKEEQIIRQHEETEAIERRSRPDLMSVSQYP